MNLVNEKLLEPLSRYSVAFILLVLIAANVYQYIDCQHIVISKDNAIEQLNNEIRKKDEKALEIERERTARMEFLLNNLPKITNEKTNTR